MMADAWQSAFRRRMELFTLQRPPKEDEVPASIKIRVVSGCFHREHSPDAYRRIDSYIDSLSLDELDFAFQEHESGPELLVYLAMTTAGITLAKSVIDLVATIIKARSDGNRSGDGPRAPLRLIIRRTRKDGDAREETVMEFEAHSTPDAEKMGRELLEAARRLLDSGTDDRT